MFLIKFALSRADVALYLHSIDELRQELLHLCVTYFQHILGYGVTEVLNT